MKIAVMVLAGLELAGLVVAWLVVVLGKSGRDLAGDGMAYAFLAIGSAIALLLIVPAVAMAYYGKLPWLALTLAVIASFFVVLAIAGL